GVDDFVEGGIYKVGDVWYVYNLTSVDNGEVEIYVNWANGPATYTEYRYQEEFDGSWTEVERTEVESVTGTGVGIDTSVSYTGFELDLSVEGTVVNGVVAPDDSTELKLYYKRIRYRVEFVLPEAGVASATSSTSTAGGADGEYYKYGAEVEIEIEMVLGYSLASLTESGVEVENGYTFEIERDMEFHVESEAGIYGYTVEYTFEGLDGVYVKDLSLLEDNTSLSGAVDSAIMESDILSVISEVSGYTYAGMVNEGELVKAYLDGDEDEQTVITVRYSRNSYELTLEATTGIESLTASGEYVTLKSEDATNRINVYTVKYEAEVELSVEMRAGYSFGSWSSEIVGADDRLEMPAEDTSIHANANRELVTYKIAYMLEDMDGAGYTQATELAEDTKRDYVDTEIELKSQLELREITGFTYETFESGVIISGEGNTVIRVYYVRDYIDIEVSMTEGISSVTLTSVAYGTYQINETITETTTLQAKYETEIELTYTLENEDGYTFAGWTGDVTLEAGVYKTVVGAEAMEIIANATNNTFTISFMANNGTGTMEDVDVTYNRSVELPNNLFTRVGYIFANVWNTESDGSGDEYENQAQFVYLLTDDLTLYAQWTAIKYSVEYDANGGVGTMEGHANIDFDEVVSLRENAFTRTGYTWIGWTYEADVVEDGVDPEIITIDASATTFVNLTAVAERVVVLHAKWSENSYRLIYNSNYTSKHAAETDVEVLDATYKYTDEITIIDYNAAKLGFNLVGYTFAGWTRDVANEDGLLTAGDVVSMMATGVVGDDEVRLYAVWTANTYTIVFNANEGLGEMEDLTATYDEEIALTANTFTRIGYTFEGWALTANGSVEYDDEETVLNLRSADGSSITLYAVWETITYTITYKPNEGTFDSSLTLDEHGFYVVNYTIEDEITILHEKLTRIGYTLIGYAYEGDTTSGNWTTSFETGIMFDELTSETFNAGLYGSVTLVAQWSINQYTLTIHYLFEESGEVAVVDYVRELDYNEDYEVETPEVIGYTADQLVVSGTMPADDVEIIVLFNPNVYVLTFDKNDSVGSSTATLNKDSMEVTYDKAYGALATAERAGYDLEGWYFETTLLTKVEGIVKIVEDTTVYAKWIARNDTTYYVDYLFEDLYGEYQIDSTITQTGTGVSDEMITEAMVKGLTGGDYPTRAGFELANVELVNLDANGTARVTISYRRLYYTVALTKGLGITDVVASVSEIPTESQPADFFIAISTDAEYDFVVRYGAHLTLVATLPDNGYTFDGFASENADLTNNIAERSVTLTMPTNNVYINIMTTPKTYKIVFNGNGGETELAETTFEQTGLTYTATETLASNQFTYEGYEFRGWATTEEIADAHTVEYTENDSYVLGLGDYAEVINLYAVWDAKPYTLKLVGDVGTTMSGTVIFVTFEGNRTQVEEIAEEISIYFDSTIEIYAEYSAESTAVRKGYDFASIKKDSEEVSVTNSYTFTFKGDTEIEITTTPRQDTIFRVVYELQGLDDKSVYTAVDDATEEIEGETDKVVTFDYITSLGYGKSFEGFGYSTLSDHENDEPVITIEYHNDDEEYTTVYVRYIRIHYGVTLTSSIGITGLYIEDVGHGEIVPLASEYRVDFETPFRLVVNLHEGYTLDDIVIIATMAENSVELVSGEESWTLVLRADGFYYEDAENGISINVIPFEIDEETGDYLVTAMPAYDLEITTVSHPNTYTVTYHRNINEEDTTVLENDNIYNEPYSIYYITTLDWEKAGYEFVGWAVSAEDAANGIVSYIYDEENPVDLDFENFLFTENIDLWAIWTPGDSTYYISYYFENVDGTFAEDEDLRAEKVAKTDMTVYYELLSDGVDTYDFDEENENGLLSGIVRPDSSEEGPLVLKVYYTRKWYNLTVTFGTGFNAVALTGTYEGLRDITPSGATGYVRASVKYGIDVTLTEDVRDGYTFDRYEDVLEIGLDLSTKTFEMPTQDIAISAIATANTYHITFYINDDKDDSYTQDFVYETSKVLDLNRFEKPGYDFVDWIITKGEDVEHYEDGALFEYDYVGNSEAIAQWSPRNDTPYTVRYYLQKIDGTYTLKTSLTMKGVTDEIVTYESVAEGYEGIEITREGYAFANMTEDVVIAGDGSGVVDAYYNLVTFDVTFEVANEGVDGVQIAYQAVDGDVSKALDGNETIAIAFSATVRVVASVAAGYELDVITIEGTDFYAAYTQEGLNVDGSVAFDVPASDVTVTIVVRRAHFEIRYFKNFKGDTTTYETQEVEYLQENVEIRAVYAEIGYTLAGWIEEENGDVVHVYEVGEIIPEFRRTSHLELFASWTPNTYNVTYDPNEGEGSIDGVTLTYDTIAEISDGTGFVLKGYKNIGWSMDGTSNIVTEVDSYSLIPLDKGIYYDKTADKYYAVNLATGTEEDKDVVLHAVWEPITYTITLAFNEARLYTEELGQFTYDETYTIDAFEDLNWTRKGYEFGGWYYYDDEDVLQTITCEADAAIDIKNLTALEREVVLYVLWETGPTTFTIRVMLESLGGNYAETIGNFYDIPVEFIAETESEMTSEKAYNEYLLGTEYAEIVGYEFLTTYNDVQQIEGEGTTIIRVRFARKYMQLSIEKIHAESVSITTESLKVQVVEAGHIWKVRFGDKVTVSVTEAQGYHDGFVEIENDLSVEGATLEDGSMSLYMNGVDSNGNILCGDIVLVANAVPDTDTEFVINIYTQNIDATYNEEADFTISGYGVTDAEVDNETVLIWIGAEERLGNIDLAGFLFAYIHSEPLTINGDGSTVVSAFYTRNAYMISSDVDNPRAATITSENRQGLFGSEYSFTFTLNKGYSFDINDLTFTSAEDESVLTIDVEETHVTTARGTTDYVIKFKVPDCDTFIMVNTTKRTDTNYRVVYMFQSSSLGTTYEQNASYPAVTLQGETEHIITRDDIGYGDLEVPGFEIVWSSVDENEVEISGTGTTTVYIYYDRTKKNVHITFNDEYTGLDVDSFKFYVAGVEAEPVESWTWRVAYGQTIRITLDIDDGFDFTSYVINGETQTTNVTGTTLRSYTMQDVDTEIVITITPRTDIVYTIEYYKQVWSEREGKYLYTYAIAPIVERGTAHQYLSYESIYNDYVENIESVAGYDENAFVGQKFSRILAFMKGTGVETNGIRIAGDGSTTIQVYFALKFINVKINYDSYRVADAEGAGEYAYGTRVALSVTMKNGYNFVEWSIDKSGNVTTEDAMPYTLLVDTNDDIVVTVITECGTSTYKAEYYFEELGKTDEQLTPRITETLTGTTESIIDADSLKLTDTEGYNFVSYSCSDDDFKIYGEKVTVVKYYYALKIVAFEVSAQEGVTNIVVSAGDNNSEVTRIDIDFENEKTIYHTKYTSMISLSVEVVVGYDFAGWRMNSGRIIPGSTELAGFLVEAPSDDFKLEACSFRKQIAIRYNPNNGTNITIDDLAEYGETVQLRSSPKPYKNGKREFLGWATEIDGEIVYVPGDSITIDFTDNLMLYAVWGEERTINWLPYIGIGAGVIGLIGLIFFLIIFIKRRKESRELKDA
ncbi:MAG: InlB B-repeat-containing protein, partial [Clostridia bacterium]|nr:InlB B-repeat-containing protein [Clostridia bacterium]